MKSFPHQSIFFDTSRHLNQMPLIRHIDSTTINTPLYSHQAEGRTDSHYIFQYTLKGSCCFEDKSGKYEIPAGSGFLCNVTDPGVYYYYCDGATESYKLLCWNFIGGEGQLRELNDSFGSVFQLPQSAPSIQYALGYTFRNDHDYKRLQIPLSKVMSLTNQLLSDLIASCEERGVTTPAQRITSEMQRFISENVEEKLMVDKLAKLLQISTGHLTRSVKEVTGKSPQKHIDALRMNYAKGLLKNTQLTVKEIAFRLNYEASAHFNRTFKRVTGLTPGAYRAGG